MPDQQTEADLATVARQAASHAAHEHEFGPSYPWEAAQLADAVLAAADQAAAGEAQTDQMVAIHQMIGAAVRYQDNKYGPFAATIAGVRLAIACLEDELDEVKGAWRSERSPKRGTRAWAATTSEVMDVLAIAVRLLRDMGVGDWTSVAAGAGTPGDEASA